jgi:hypothetical protein
MVAIIGAVDPDDVYDEAALRRIQEAVLVKEIGLSQEVVEMLTPRRVDDGTSTRLIGDGTTADNLPLPPAPRRTPPPRPATPPEEAAGTETDASEDESSDDNLSLEQLRAARRAAEARRMVNEEVEIESE